MTASIKIYKTVNPLRPTHTQLSSCAIDLIKKLFIFSHFFYRKIKRF